jgi:DNA-binding CsgD family transcriptional regulator
VDTLDMLLERDAERHELAVLLDRAVERAGGVAVVEGPAGIGKTMLLEATRGFASERGLAIGRARGGTLEQEIAFGAVHQLLEPLIAMADNDDGLFTGGAAAAATVFGRPVAGTGHDDGGPGTVLHGLYWLTMALSERLGPMALLCDDAHWFDTPSLRYIAYLANRIDELPIAVAVGTRPPEPGPEGEVLARFLTYQGLRRLRLSPLSREAVGRLVERTVDDAGPALSNAVADASNGNPFLVTELVRAAIASGTDAVAAASLAAINLDQTVLARIGRLSERALDVARAVAVLGGEAHLRHVASVCELKGDEALDIADQLLRADILGPDRPLAFAHPLVASAVYGELLPGERSVLHRRAANALATEGAPADRVAPHLMAIDPAADEHTVDVLVRSARSALAQGGTEIAVTQLRRALAEPPPPARRLDVILPLAIAESLLNDPGAVEHFGEAIERIPDIGARIKLATARAASMSMDGASAAAIESLRRWEPDVAGVSELRSRLLAGINIAGTIGPTPPELMAANMAEFCATVDLEAEAPAEVLAIRAYVGAMSGEPAADVAALAFRAIDSIDLRDPMLPLWFHLPMAALPMVDRDSVSDVLLDRGLTPARHAGAPAQVAVMLFQRGVIGVRAGDLDDAEADARAALELCVEHGLQYVLPAPLSILVDVMRERDQLDAAASLLAEHGYVHGDRGSTFDLLLMFARARLRAAQGGWEQAATEFAGGWERARAAGCSSPGFVAWEANLAEALVMCGRLGEAADHSRHAVAEAEFIGLQRPRAEALRSLALADPAGSSGGLAVASEIFEFLGARLEQARTAAAAAYVAEIGGPAATTDTLSQGLWLAERCGAARLSTALRSALRSLGVRAKVRPVVGVGALTASERRVAQLAGAGRTNKQIAQDLFVTVKTVETHLARSFQKLAVSSRGELRQALAESA